MMLQTVFVYSSMTVLMSLFGVVASRRATRYPNTRLSFFHWEVFFPLCLFAVVFGLRYDVGVDHLEYLEKYQTLIGIERFEPIFQWVTLIFHEQGIHYVFYFALWALLQVSLVYYSLKDERYLYPFLAISLFMGQFFWHWMNGIRQDLAACVFLYATIFIVKKEFWKYLLCCIIAAGFHKTAVLLLPVYFIFVTKNDWLKNRFIQYCLLVIAALVAVSNYDIVTSIFPLIDYFILLLDYDIYSEQALDKFAELTKSGVSLYAFILIDFIIIFYSFKLKKYYQSRKFDIIYNLYFFGTIMQLLFTNNMLLARPFRYFRYFKLLILAYLLYFLWKKGGKNCDTTLVFFVVMSLLFILFAAIIKNEPFYFFWEF